MSDKKRQPDDQAQGGAPPCKHGTRATTHTLTSLDSYGREKAQTIEAMTCDLCRQEAVAELEGQICTNCGDGEMIIQDQAWAKCDRCGHSCPLQHLERQVHQSPASVINQQIAACLAEDRRRGSRGGGSGDKGPKKEDKLGRVTLKQANWSEEEIAKKILKQESLEPKGEYIRVRGLPEDATGEQVRKALEWMLTKRKGLLENGLNIEYPDTAQERT